MKTRSKSILLVLCAVLLVAASVLGTLAYLTATDTVTNAFTLGQVAITMDEADVNEDGQLLNKNGGVYDPDAEVAQELADRVTQNEYKLVPGHSYTKDPTVHVSSTSEACWLFVKVTNGIANIEDSTNTIAAQMTTKGWTLIDEDNNVWGKTTTVSAGTNVVVFESFKIADSVDSTTLANYEDAEIEIVAYAVQADAFQTAQAAWAGSGFATQE